MSAFVRGFRTGSDVGAKIADTYLTTRKLSDERKKEEDRRKALEEFSKIGGTIDEAMPSAQTQQAQPPTEGLGAQRTQVSSRSEKSNGYTDVAAGMTGASEPGSRRATASAENPYMAMADAEAKRVGIDPKIYRNLVNQESRWNPKARSPVGAFGLTQIMPDTAKRPGFNVAPLRDQSPQEQLRFGADYFKALLDEFDGDYQLAAAAYNAGPGRVKEAGGVPNIKETRDYVAKVVGDYRPVDPRTASTTGSGPAVSPHTLPDRQAGLGQQPQDERQRFNQFMQQADPDKLADMYQQRAMWVANNPQYAADVAPALQALQQIGLARHMQAYQGDPMSLDAWRHYGRGAAKFGIVVSPDKGISLQFQANQDARAERGDDRDERRLRHAITQDELQNDRAERQLGLSENADRRQEGLAKRQQESHEAEMGAKELEAQQEKLELQKEKLKLRNEMILKLDKYLSDGELQPFEQEKLKLDFGVEFTGNKKKSSAFIPGAPEAQEIVEYEVKMPDGSVVWASKEMVAAEAAAIDEITKLSGEKPKKSEVRNFPEEFKKGEGNFAEVVIEGVPYEIVYDNNGRVVGRRAIKDLDSKNTGDKEAKPAQEENKTKKALEDFIKSIRGGQ